MEIKAQIAHPSLLLLPIQTQHMAPQRQHLYAEHSQLCQHLLELIAQLTYSHSNIIKNEAFAA